MTAKEVSNYIISLAKDSSEEDLTNLKLQKILYYLQGYYLAIYNEKLFEDDIEPWKYGPVVCKVYLAYKDYANSSISMPDIEIDFDYIPDPQKKFINKVYAYFRQFSAIKLMEMTHNDLPWKATYGKQKVIPVELLHDFFYKSDLKELFKLSDKNKEMEYASHFLLADYIYNTDLIETTISDTDDIYEY